MMSLCLIPDASGALAVTVDAPQQCAGYLALTPSEYAAATSSVFPPLTLEQGATIALAVGSLWALAFLFRALKNSLSNQTGDS